MDYKYRIIICGDCPEISQAILFKMALVDSRFRPNILYTTRRPRNHEINGFHYNFISGSKFMHMLPAFENYTIGDIMYGCKRSYRHNVYIKKYKEIKRLEAKFGPKYFKDSIIVYVSQNEPKLNIGNEILADYNLYNATTLLKKCKIIDEKVLLLILVHSILVKSNIINISNVFYIF